MYTKHYYAGSSRIASRIGGGFVAHRDLNDYSPVATADRVPLLQTSSYDHKAENLRNLWARAGECMGVSLEYAYSLESSGLYLNPTETADGERYFYHSDHLGSSAFVTTEMRSIREDLQKSNTTEQNGYATQFLAYMPFGETLAEQQNGTSYYSPFKFSAKEKDPETGYSYFGARYYAPELSVWLSVDPMADKRPWLSAYNYCQLNPVMRVDPTGMIDIMIEDFSGGGEGDGNGDPPAKSSAPKNQPGASSGVNQITVNNNNGNRTASGQTRPSTSSSSSNREGSNWATATLALIATDVSVPDPTDVAPIKWAAYAVTGTAAAVYIHANSKNSPKPNIVYELYAISLTEGHQVMKYGVSSRADYVTREGNPRPEYQAMILNAMEPAGSGRYYWYRILDRTSNRETALELEKGYVREYQAKHGGLRPPLQVRP